jgi:LacI family gluconate utilization system Gnt-I transcriptional repressor
VPVVEVANLPKDPIDSAVGFSVGDAFFELGKALYEREYRKFGFLQRDLGDDELSAPRLERLRSALATFGMELPDSAVQDCEEPTVRSAKLGFEALIKREPALDIVVCSTDYLAYGAAIYCRQNGIAVPNDTAIAGFGDMEFSADFSPTLTTISVDGRDIGRKAAEHLVHRIEDGAPGGCIDDVGYRIVFRESA